MISEHVRMSRWRFILAGVVLAAGCTKPNPRSCADGTCTDPAFPFCDVGGELSGTPKQCIAVACNAGEVDLCRGDQAVTCNAEGTDYDIVQCDLGCDVNIGGCRLCEPNETACTNGTVATCDANGNVTSSEACALGCFEDEPRCREIDAANGLSEYLDMVDNPPDVDLVDASIDTATGEIRDGGSVVAVPSFTVAAQTGGAPIRVFVTNTLKIAKAYVIGAQDPRDLGAAVAFVSRGDITVSGQLRVMGSAGGVESAACKGGQGEVKPNAGNTQWFSSGGGGGGHGTIGAAGGAVTSYCAAGGAGQPNGSDNLVPLRGGCPGGGVNDDLGPYIDGSVGGGAIQLSSRTRIEINGVVDARGDDGGLENYNQTNGIVVLGAGAGGGILVEAPDVALGPNAKVLVPGGNGGSACTTPTVNCALGGAGATRGVPALSGGNIAIGGGGQAITAGGGGGGQGRIRINTRDQTYTKANTTVEDGVLSVGTLSTR